MQGRGVLGRGRRRREVERARLSLLHRGDAWRGYKNSVLWSSNFPVLDAPRRNRPSSKTTSTHFSSFLSRMDRTVFFFFFVVLMRFFPCCLADHDGGAVAVCSVSITVPKTVDQKVVQVNPFDGFAADLWPKGVDGVGPRDRKSLDFCCPVCWCCCHFEAA